ncbi:4'-phosphopantetheinyl transferase family protein [Streptomyces chlorus]|uniref:4'-phosphopantetheinyl transferase family protein n=1 Tax=Streptomyces chlorus TaxID=887452 RepID=A0ABW1DSH1_9ACTN
MAHVWCRPVNGVAEVRGGARPTDVEWTLSDAERARRDTLCRTQDRALYTAAWGLVRQSLSAAEPWVRPDEWRFQRSSLGRPEVHHPVRGRSLRFNLSHTEGMVACVVTRDARCGVDVERPGRALPLHRLTRTVLSAREQREFDLAPPGRRQELFFRYWTLKEAYLKAIGTGLRFPMTACEFDLGGGRPALRSLAAGPRHAHYTFRQWPVLHGGLLAVAVQGGPWHTGEDDVTIRAHLPQIREECTHHSYF